MVARSPSWFFFVVCIGVAMVFLRQGGRLQAVEPATSPSPAPWNRYKIEIAPDEAAWLAQHPKVRISGDPAWPPFSCYSKLRGRFEGSDFEILRIAIARLGLQAEEIPVTDWTDVVRKVDADVVDIVTSTTPTPDRAQQLLFTRPYFSLPVAVVARRDAPFLINLNHLGAGVRVAGPRGYITTEQFARDHPGVPMVFTTTSREALESVDRGGADLAIDNLGVASHYIRQHRLTNLKVAGFLDNQFELSMGVRRDLPLLWSSLDKALASITPEERSEVMGRWLTDDYSPGLRWRGVLVAVGLLLVAAGAIVGFLVWHNTRLKREIIQRQLAEANLRVLNEQLKRLSEEKTAFMKMAAHDLKNPLGAVLGTTELLLEHQLTRALDQRTASLVGDVQENAYRMLRLIRNLLDADAIERGQTNLRPHEVTLQKAVGEALSRFRHGAGRKQIDLSQDIATSGDGPLKIWADEDALSQILDNLISNAVKFSPRGGKVVVHVSGPFEQSGGSSARLAVCDQGPGISDADKPLLFEPHAQLTSRPTAGETSHGLGLSIVRRLSASMGGSVTCENNPDGGACFVVELPAVETQASVTH